MDERHVVQMLAAHAEGLINRRENMQQIKMMDEEHSRIGPLFQLAERLQQSMQPVQPSATFMRSLGQELVDNAQRQIMLTKRLRRAMLIGAAALGSLLSIASVVGAIVLVITWLRGRAQAQTIHTPTGQTEIAPA
jgi:hypothetical protein